MFELYFARGPVLIVHGDSLHRIQGCVCAVDNLTKDRILSVEVRLFRVGDKKLGFIRIRTIIRHGHNTTGVEL